MNSKFLLALAAVCAGVTLAKSGGAAVPPIEKDRERALSVLAENVYGVRPDLKGFKKTQRVVEAADVPELGAVRQTVELNVLTPIGERTFKAYAYFPRRDGKVPAFVYLSFCDPEAFDKDPNYGNLRWDVKDVLAHGCATVAFDYREVFPDGTAEIADWGRGPSRPADGWGAISCWALAASRVVDWLVTCPQVDADKLGVVGLSRLGKTALWAGATDPRFALVASVCSGCFGARLQDVNWRGETVEQIVAQFPHWFAPNCRKLIGKDRELPFGQHWLLATIAPRLLVVASAEDDWWACPSGEMLAWERSREAWGRARDRSHYFIRKGEHNIRESNWIDILNFVRSHGWMTDELKPETALWQKAIDACSAAGGGRVTVPPGTHVVGQLYLRSNVELHLEQGATLQGARGLHNYTLHRLPYSEGDWAAVVMALGVTNVAITGRGEVFGDGAGFEQVNAKGICQEGFRPRGIFFADAKGIRLEDFTLRDAACWGVVFKCCEDVVVRRVTVNSQANLNNDGFDIEARNVLIEGCDVDSGDDAYCVKSNDPTFVVEDVTVRDCIARSHCNGFKIGTATHGTVRRVRFEHCRAEAPRRVYRDLVPMPKDLRKPVIPDGAPWYLFGPGVDAICIECVDGGTVEDVVADDIEVRGFAVPIFVRGGSRSGRTCGTPPGTDYCFRDIVVSNVRGQAEGTIPSTVTGCAKCRPKNVRLENVDIVCWGDDKRGAPFSEPGPEFDGCYPGSLMFQRLHLPSYGLYADRWSDVALKNVRFTLRDGEGDERPAVLCRSENKARQE